MLNKKNNDPHPQTAAVHAGVYQDKQFNSVTTPIYTTSTFFFDSIEEPPKFDYTRSGNPTRYALQENLVQLEGGHAAFAICSGMAAIHTVLSLLSSGDHVICGNEVYGGTHRLFSQVTPKAGIKFSHVDMTDSDAIENAVCDNTKLIWIETPTNPLLNIVDISAVVKIAKQHKIITALDNTFLTPVLQRGFELGVDIVVHSTTKYLNGHSDIVGGAIITGSRDLSERVAFLVNAIGVGQSPYDSWLVLRGIKTLLPRMEAHQKSADAISKMLNEHSAVKKVFYPGLDSHPHHDLAKKQQSGFGAIVTFEVDLEKIDISKFFKNLKYFSLCVSLGGVESLIEQPWSMSHLAMPDADRLAVGITPGIIRISAGIEYPDDLVNDLLSAFEIAKK